MAIKEKVKEQSKQQRYIAANKVDEHKKNGWKEIPVTDERMKKLIDRNKDLVLMEK